MLPSFLSCHHASVDAVTHHPRAENLNDVILSMSATRKHATSLATQALILFIATSLDDISVFATWFVTHPGQLEADLDHVAVGWSLILTMDPLTLTFVDFDFCVDLWPKVKIFKRAYLALFFAYSVSSFEALKIGQLAHSSLWFFQRHSSRHLQGTFSCLSNLKPSLSFRLEFEGGW